MKSHGNNHIILYDEILETLLDITTTAINLIFSVSVTFLYSSLIESIK